MKVFVEKALLVAVAGAAIVVSALLTIEELVSRWIRWQVARPGWS